MAKHGAPDWYRYRRESLTFALADLAELAARLGSPVTFDRRGDVIWFDTFEHGLNRWTIGSTGEDGSVAISPKSYRTRGYSALLISASAGDMAAEIYTRLAYPHLAAFGAEMAFTLSEQHSYLIYRLRTYTGTLYYDAELKYDVTAEKLYYLDAAATYQELNPPLVLIANVKIFHQLKLVCNPLTGAYVRALLDNEGHSMTDIPMFSHASTQDPHILVDIYLKAVAGNNPKCYVDDVIVTQDEP